METFIYYVYTELLKTRMRRRWWAFLGDPVVAHFIWDDRQFHTHHFLKLSNLELVLYLLTTILPTLH